MHKTELTTQYQAEITFGFLVSQLLGIDFSRNSVVQEFIEDAHLFEGYRYDIGVYVLLTSLSPIRAYTLDEWRIK